MITMKGQFNSANIFIDEIDDTAREQIQVFLNHPAFHGGYIAIMPDCHAGVGAVIGFTMKMNGYVLPTIVGVDIGCGVLAARVESQGIDLAALDKFIRAEIPAGFHIHEKPHDLQVGAELYDVCEAIEYDRLKALRSIGTLGGGNHFIEVDRDETTGALWLIVHSGSRNFGLSIANFYQRKAKEGLESYFIRDEYKGLEFIPPANPDAAAYLRAMCVAQDFASLNRRMMMRKLFEFVGSGSELSPQIESVHNYMDLDAGIIRKGAIAANDGQFCIIPFNMMDGVAICRGKGSAKHNYSAPHGAGRSMSRKQAKATLSLDEFTGGMAAAGVYTTTANASTLDEAPASYKPMDTILKNIEETVEVVTMLKPIYNFKAAE